jgi:hypothetical protein
MMWFVRSLDFLRSLNHSGYKIEAALGGGRYGLEGIALVAFGNFVGAQTLYRIQWVGQRLYVVSVGGAELVNQAEDVAQVVFQCGYLFVIKTDTGQHGDFFNVCAGNGHVDSGFSYLIFRLRRSVFTAEFISTSTRSV